MGLENHEGDGADGGGTDDGVAGRVSALQREDWNYGKKKKVSIGVELYEREGGRET